LLYPLVWVCAAILVPSSIVLSQDYNSHYQAKSVYHGQSSKHIGVDKRLVYDTQKLRTVTGIHFTGGYLCKLAPRIEVDFSYIDMSSKKALNLSNSNAVSAFVLHGNIQYDFLYRSIVDTPYYQEDLRQHSLRTNLRILFREQYPTQVNFTLRYSNSPYFTNFFDVGFLYNRFDYERQMKAILIQKVERSLYNELLLAELIDSANRMKSRLEQFALANSDADMIIKQIAEREREYHRRLRLAEDSLPAVLPYNLSRTSVDKFGHFMNDRDADIIDDTHAQKIATNASRIDSLREEWMTTNQRIRHMVDSVKSEVIRQKQTINSSRSVGELRKLPWVLQLDSSKSSKIDQVLGNVKSLGIGRTMLNFSELTVSNVSLTGLSFEYNPKIYTALAVGKVDYGFRDFLGRNTRSRGQELAMARFGVGDVNRKAVIFSMYTGKKYNYIHSFADSTSDRMPVTGISIEGILKKNELTYVVAEIAKSTVPIVGQGGSGKSFQSLLKMGDKSNIGLSIKTQAMFPKSRTRISGMIRRTGENFQSFSLLAYQTNQLNWNVKLDQPFLKNRLNVSGALRRNDFTNPFTEKSFKTSTIFKSFQMDMRIPNWPQISVSYHPNSQLYIVDENRVREDAFYVVNASAVYPYQLGGLRMSTILVYNDFSSRGTDSGFFSYNGKSYHATQQLYLNWGSLHSSYAYSDQAPFGYHTVDGGVDMTFKKVFSFSGTTSFNHVKQANHYWGGRLMMGVDFRYFGNLQLQYEKSYLPTLSASLYPVENGRLTWTKIF
jgi:hypothetical protein